MPLHTRGMQRHSRRRGGILRKLAITLGLLVALGIVLPIFLEVVAEEVATSVIEQRTGGRASFDRVRLKLTGSVLRSLPAFLRQHSIQLTELSSWIM